MLSITWIPQMGPGVYQVSASGGGSAYLVDTTVCACSCPAHLLHGACKHQAAVRRRIGIAQRPDVTSEEVRRQLMRIATGMTFVYICGRPSMGHMSLI